jgi:hypothetical protein
MSDRFQYEKSALAGNPQQAEMWHQVLERVGTENVRRRNQSSLGATCRTGLVLITTQVMFILVVFPLVTMITAISMMFPTSTRRTEGTASSRKGRARSLK